MFTIEQMLARITADNDQETMMVRQWFAEASMEDLCRLWLQIQQPYQNEVMEIMSRMAQLKFAELAVERFGKKARNDS